MQIGIGLTQKNGMWIVRKQVPPRLREAVARVLDNNKQSQMWLQRSTGTKDKAEAKRADIAANHGRVRRDIAEGRGAAGRASTADNTDTAGDKQAGQSLKTAGSARTIPIHPELVRLGLLDYVLGQQEARGGWLFPAVATDKAANNYSAWVGRWLDRLVLGGGRRGLHSLRHCFKDALRAGGVDEGLGDALTDTATRLWVGPTEHGPSTRARGTR